MGGTVNSIHTSRGSVWIVQALMAQIMGAHCGVQSQIVVEAASLRFRYEPRWAHARLEGHEEADVGLAGSTLPLPPLTILHQQL